MRRLRILPLLAVLAVSLASGCNIFHDFYIPGQHFQFGTTKQVELSRNVNDVTQNVQIVLKEQEYSISKVEQGEDSAQVWATKDGLNYVFDIKGQNSGSIVRLEIDQAGNDGTAWTLMQQLQSMP